MVKTAPETMRTRSHPRSASGANHRLAKSVKVKDMPASNPSDQVGKPNLSWMSARSEMITPMPIAIVPMKASIARRGRLWGERGIPPVYDGRTGGPADRVLDGAEEDT